MAFIKSLEVEQLATRKVDRKIDFNRDINVFFGTNGSGKTSLLRILHSALSGRSSDLRKIPFSRASVNFGNVYVFNMTTNDFYGDLTRQTLAEMPSDRQATLLDIEPPDKRVGKKLWYAATSEIEDQAFEIRHTYLPISRLYVHDDRRFPRALRESGKTALLSEPAVERQFAEVVNFLWLRYTRNTGLEIQEKQAEGLNKILTDFLAPDEEVIEPFETDIEEAYKRLLGFLDRQPGRMSITLEAFAKRINIDQRMRRVLKDIEAVETEVERIRIPKNEFDRILSVMISPEKKVELGGRDIHAFAASEEIDLGDLSSGEKQLLRICIDVLLADGSPILIDEPELSMHIDWQRRLIPALHALAPRSQLIIATHSPEIMAPLSEDQIFEL